MRILLISFYFCSVCFWRREESSAELCVGSKIILEAFALNVVSASPTHSDPGVLFSLLVSLATLQLAVALEAFLPSSFSTDKRFSRGSFGKQAHLRLKIL
jgi:hypothetical protein